MVSRPNIEFMLKMTDDFINGIIDPISYDLDFPYELETRFKAMRREDRDFAELIYDRLYEDGIVKKHHQNFDDDAFIKLMWKQLESIRGIIRDGFW